MASFTDFQVLYSNGAPADNIRLGQLLVDESEAAPADMLKYCSSLSPPVYTSVVGGGGGGGGPETVLTVANETATFPNSRRVLAGTNITFDDSVANVRTLNVGAFPSGANPTASVGLAAVNGAAVTFMRSDGAPALSQSIAPTWTGIHTFLLAGANPSPVLLSANDNSALSLLIDNDSNGTVNMARMAITSGDVNLSVYVSGTGRTTAPVTGGPVGGQAGIRTLGAHPLVFATSNTFRFQIDDDGSWTDSAASTGAAGNVWTSNGAASSPTWQAGGAGSTTITRVVVNLPYPAKRSHVVNVVDAAIGATNKIILSVDGAEETQTNASDSIDVLTMSANPNAGSFDLQMNFLTPTAGPVSINYIRAA